MFGIATSLINDAFAWAGITKIRVEENEEETQVFDVDGSLQDVVNEMATAIVVLYFKFQGHKDAREIMEEAARLAMGDISGEV